MKPIVAFLGACALLGAAGCALTNSEPAEPRLALFVGVDVSGSFVHSASYDDSLDFLARYLDAHLRGLGGLERPSHLFVAPIGGAAVADAKTFFPIQTFAGRPVPEIRQKLAELFPKTHEDPYTDFNAFFVHVAQTAKDRNLLLKPIAIVLISDGVVDTPDRKGHDPRTIDLSPLETLSRDVTVRLLYTDPRTGASWRSQVRRRRVKLWTQDAAVMTAWKDPALLQADAPADKQDKFFGWIADNVDYGVRAQRVD